MLFMTLLIVLFVLYTRLMVLELGQMQRTDTAQLATPTELAGSPGVPKRRIGGGSRNTEETDGTDGTA